MTRRLFVFGILWTLLLAAGVCKDIAVTAIAALTDPAKLATLACDIYSSNR